MVEQTARLTLCCSSTALTLTALSGNPRSLGQSLSMAWLGPCVHYSERPTEKALSHRAQELEEGDAVFITQLKKSETHSNCSPEGPRQIEPWCLQQGPLRACSPVWSSQLALFVEPVSPGSHSRGPQGHTGLYNSVQLRLSSSLYFRLCANHGDIIQTKTNYRTRQLICGRQSSSETQDLTGRGALVLRGFLSSSKENTG